MTSVVRRVAVAVVVALAACRRPAPVRRAVAARDVPPPTVAAAPHRPVAALYEENPWLMVVGSDAPSVVLYEDGHVIHAVGEGRDARMVEGHLGPGAARRFVRDHADLAGVAPFTECSGSTDQPTVRILVRVGDRWDVRSVYGFSTDPRAHYPEDAPAPPAFARAYRDLVALRAADDRPWVPETVEVMVWGFDYARAAVPWPPDLPPPPPTLLPPDGGTASMLVAGRHRARVVELVRSLGEATAVSFNGHRWAVSLRDVVPEEAALAEARRQ